MKTSLRIFAAVLLLLAAAPSSHGVQPPQNIQWDGVITEITATSVTVKSPKGSKVFAIHPGTVFGQRAAKKISDFKAGDNVRVVFSSAGGQMKAENIRNPDGDRKPAAKKAKPAAKK